MPQMESRRKRGLLYPIKPKPGSTGAQPAVQNVFLSLTPGSFKAGCLGFGVATLCMISQPMKWGSNGELRHKRLYLQQRHLGTHGEEWRKSFRNGEQGKG